MVGWKIGLSNTFDPIDGISSALFSDVAEDDDIESLLLGFFDIFLFIYLGKVRCPNSDTMKT